MRGVMKGRRVGLCLSTGLLLLCSTTHAQQLTYTPINPSFGGNPFNSSHLLGLANAQNQFLPSATASAAPTQAELFASQLQSTILSGVAQQVSNAIFGNNPQQSGTISFGGTTVSFNRDLSGVTINITDPRGAATQIVVPTFVASGGG